MLFLRLRIEIEANNKPSLLINDALCVLVVRFGSVWFGRLAYQVAYDGDRKSCDGGIWTRGGAGRTKQEEACGSARSRAMQSANLTLLFLLLLFFFYILWFFWWTWSDHSMTLDVGDKTSDKSDSWRGWRGEGRVAMIPARYWDRPRPLISLRQVQNVRRNC